MVFSEQRLSSCSIQPSLAQRDLKIFLNDGLWPPLVTQLSSAMESPLNTGLQNAGNGIDLTPHEETGGS